MDITIGDISSVKNDLSEENTIPPSNKKSGLKDRRKNKQDRRKSVREGIFVSLSTKNERRITRDRRKTGV